jgi:hypothetical protein
MIVSKILNGVRFHVQNDYRLISVANDVPLITWRGRVKAQDLVIGDHIDGWGEIVWIEHFAEKYVPEIKERSNVGPTNGPINDYVCPTCQNNRCSKSEIKCWRCGGVL